MITKYYCRSQKKRFNIQGDIASNQQMSINYHFLFRGSISAKNDKVKGFLRYKELE